jgi:hypothetical protein
MSPTTAKAKIKKLESLDWIYKMDALDVDATRFVVRKGGVIDGKDAPAALRLHQNDIVAWFITNASGGDITVEFIDFALKLKKKKIQPIEYVTENPVTVKNGDTAVVYGTVTRKPDSTFMPDFVKYTIRVQGSFGAIDYDPDLEIKP